RHVEHAAAGEVAHLELREAIQRQRAALVWAERAGAQRGNVERRHVPGDASLLRQIAGDGGPLALAQRFQRPPGEPNRACGARLQAERGAQQSRLAGAVRADQAQHLAGSDVERDVRQHVTPAAAHRQPLQFEHRRHARQLLAARQAISANSGAPKRAVTTPSRSSSSEGITRAARSARVSRMAPANADGTSVRAGSSDTEPRTMCGAASPTKPITPAIATDAPVSSAAPATATTRSRAIGRPESEAVSSPSVSMRRPMAA